MSIACRKNKKMSLALSDEEQVGLDSFNGNMQIPLPSNLLLPKRPTSLFFLIYSAKERCIFPIKFFFFLFSPNSNFFLSFTFFLKEILLFFISETFKGFFSSDCSIEVRDNSDGSK